MDNTLTFIDSHLPKDEFINSTLGKYDGDVYRWIIGEIWDHHNNIGRVRNEK